MTALTNFEYAGSTKDESFYGYTESKKLFNSLKSSRIKFSEVKNKQNEFFK